jgi:amino acid permease
MPNVIESLYHDLSTHDAPIWTQSGRNWLTVFMLTLTPLTFLRKLDQLRHTSYIALFAAGELLVVNLVKVTKHQFNSAYLVAIVIVCYIHPLKGSSPPGNIYLVHFTPSFIANFPVQVFAFTCAQNVRICSHLCHSPR